MQTRDLWTAARAGDAEGLIALLDADVALDARNSRGHSALMLAAYAGYADCVSALIARGADVDSSDDRGHSVLMGVAYKGYLPLARALIEAGAHADARSGSGLTALDFATIFGRADVADYLRRQMGLPAEENRLVAFWKILFGRLKSRVPCDTQREC